jgi:hypothetical protein
VVSWDPIASGFRRKSVDGVPVVPPELKLCIPFGAGEQCFTWAMTIVP